MEAYFVMAGELLLWINGVNPIGNKEASLKALLSSEGNRNSLPGRKHILIAGGFSLDQRS